jgi:phage shock protein PspC (stress-responsive transcriptional regulator)
MEENTNTNTYAGTDSSTDGKPRELRRTRQGRMIAGVCSGAAEYLSVDANILRLVLAGLTIISGGAGAAIYVAGWLLIPEEGESASIVQGLINKQEQKKQQRQNG